MSLTFGFPRSGGSLLGYLLTAHPNIVMADEAFYPIQYIQKHGISDLNKIFNRLLEHDKRMPSLHNMYHNKSRWKNLNNKILTKIMNIHTYKVL